MNKIKIGLVSGATLIVLDVLFFLMVVVGVPANVLFFQMVLIFLVAVVTIVATLVAIHDLTK